MIEYKKYSLEQAKNRYDDLESGGFKGEKLSKTSPFYNLRNALLFVFYNKNEEKQYPLDLAYGKVIHKEILKLNGLDEFLLTTSTFWRFIALDIIPEIIVDRFGNDGGKNKDSLRTHFYSKLVRIYPYSLFWYYDIFNKGNEEETYNFLSQKMFSTDTILNTIERMGRNGFRKDIYNKIVTEYSKLDFKKYLPTQPKDILRKVLIQHTSKNTVFVPDCYEGGIDGYIQMLFNTALGGK